MRNPGSASTTYVPGGGFANFTATCSVTTDVTPTQGVCETYSNAAAGAAGGGGQQATGEASPVTAIAVVPGTQVRYKLDVNNNGAGADSYNLGYNVGSGAWTLSGTNPTWTTPGSLPAGITLQFFADGGANNCSTIGASAITNTGVVAQGQTKLVCAVVTIAAGTGPSTSDLYFQAISPTTVISVTGSSADVKHDQLRVNTLRSVTITPNNSGQIFPGGSIQYCHTVANVGNVNEVTVTIGNTNSLGAPWPANATIYRDLNNNCALDPADIAAGAFTSGSLNPLPINAGTSQNYIIVVQAPAAATAGQTNVTTVTVTPSGTINGVPASAASIATDSTVVVVGQVTLVKSQQIDATCNNAAYGPANSTAPYLAAFSQGTLAANPGQCIIYQIVATNIGTQPVTSVQLFDSTPGNTTCNAAPYTLTGGSTTTNVTSGTCAAVGGTAANLTMSLNPVTTALPANATMTLYFRVKVNP